MMVEAISHALGAVELFNAEDPIMLEIRDELFSHLEEYTGQVILGKGQRVQVPSTHIMVETVVFPDDDTDYSYIFETFELPKEAVAMARGLKATPRLQIKGYSDALFSHWGTKRDWDDGASGKIGNGTGTEAQLSGSKWRIYDVQFAGVEIANLTSPISYTMAVNHSERFEWVCTFWNVEGELAPCRL